MNTISPKDPKTILNEVVYYCVATTNGDGSPWASPVFACYDADAKAVYWCSAKDSRHSQNIEQTGLVLISVYDSVAAPGQGWGVYLKGVAEEVTNPQARAHAHAQLKAKHRTPYWSLEEVQGQSPIRLYKMQVSEAWVNQARLEKGYYVNDRLSITL